MTLDPKLNVVPFISVHHMMNLVLKVGIDTFLIELAAAIEEDFRRWPVFDKTPRVASHTREGVIELMPTSDGSLYGFKYVNGHPKNMHEGRQTVTAFGAGRGQRILLGRNAVGVTFEVAVDRGFDISSLSIGGINIGWHSPTQMRFPTTDPTSEDGPGFLRNFTASW